MRRRSLAILVPHTVLLIAAWVLVGRDAVAPFGGAGLVTSIVPLLAVIVAAAVRAARGIAGAKPLLLASDLGIAALTGVTWALADPRFVDEPSWLYASTIAVALVSAVAGLLLPSGQRASVEREGWSWALPAAIAVIDLAAIGNFSVGLSGAEVTNTLPILGTYALALGVGDGVALVAWWWACRWPLGIGAIASAGAWLAATVENPETISAHRADAAIAAIAIALGLVAVAIGPTLRPGPPEPASLEPPPSEPPPTRSRSSIPRPAAIWSIVGAVLYPWLAWFGVFPIVSDLSWSGPESPAQDLLIGLTLVSVVAVPVSTVILLLAAGRPGGRWPAVVLLGTGILVLVELTLAALGYGRFAYLFVAAGPAALVGLGGFAFLWPRIGRLAGAACSLAAAAIVVAWFAGTIAVNGFGFDPGMALGSFPAGLLLPLAIAWEGDRAVRLGPPDESARAGTIGSVEHLDTPGGGP